jgi:hypothetical protein
MVVVSDQSITTMTSITATNDALVKYSCGRLPLDPNADKVRADPYL